MATKVVMEALSPTMEEGKLVKWTKKEGDKVTKGEVLAEVETDKAVMEIVARGDGVMRKIIAAEGETRPVGELLAIVGTPDENIDAIAGSAAAPAPAAAAAPAPTPTAPPRPASPPPAPAAPPSTPAAARTEQAPHAAESGGRLRSSPLARRLASERGVALDQLQGSGPGGRIIKRDIESAGTQSQSPATANSRQSAPGVGFEDVPLSQLRKTIARRLAESIGPIPTFYLTAEFDLSRVAEMRSAMAEVGDEFKVSFNDIILKATATALAQHPEVNAHWLGDKIRRFNRVHLGMAVAIRRTVSSRR